MAELGKSDDSSTDEKELRSDLQDVRGRYKIGELLAQLPHDYRPEELDWGPPQGREVW